MMIVFLHLVVVVVAVAVLALVVIIVVDCTILVVHSKHDVIEIVNVVQDV